MAEQKQPNTGAPRPPGAPTAPAPGEKGGGPKQPPPPQPRAEIPDVSVGPANSNLPQWADPMANPVLFDPPAASRLLNPADHNSNPAALGIPMHTNPGPGVVQTTIDHTTTTIHPDSSMANPVDRGGRPSPEYIKRADFGRAPGAQVSGPHPPESGSGSGSPPPASAPETKKA